MRVYRITNGKMELVRTDKIPKGGTLVCGWNYYTNLVIKPEATEAFWTWDDWSRKGTTDWVTIMAVDKAGNVTPGNAVSVQRPDAKFTGMPKDKNPMIPFKPVKLPEGSKSALAAPQNVKAEVTSDNLVRLTWDPVNDPDVAGYVIAQSDINPSEHKGVCIQLAEKATNPEKQIKTGDMVIVETEFRTFDRKLRSNRVGNLWRTNAEFYPGCVPSEFYPGEIPGKTWTLKDHEKNTAVTEPGRTYLEMTLPAGDEQKIGKSSLSDIGNSSQDYYNVTKPVDYTMEVWMKADRADAPAVTFELDDGRQTPKFLEPFTFQPTTEWKKFTTTFSGTAALNTQLSFFVLTCKGPATYSVDNFRIYESDTPYLGMTPDESRKYTDSGMMAIRTHAPIKTFTATYTMDSFTNPGGVTQGISNGDTLPQMLSVMEKLKTRPWLQIEFHMSPEEWLGFIEFMAAPYDPATDSPQTKPWAAKRYAQGHKAPWTDAFDRIYFELSNETWNRMFAPWIFDNMPDSATGKILTNGEVYGKMQDFVIETFRKSPYWNSDLEKKFVPVMGGWAIGTYNKDAVSASKEGKYITIAAYNGGWDEGESSPKLEPASFFKVLSQTTTSAIPTSRAMLQMKVDFAKAGHSIELGTYEAGPGYAMNGLNGDRVSKEQAADQEKVMKSKVAGTATLDAFLVHAYYGCTLQNFFTFGEGGLWTSHTKWYRGGQAYPSFLALTMFNKFGTGDMLHTETTSVSTVDLPKFQRRIAMPGAPRAAVFATRKGNQVAVFCINREFPGYPDPAADGFTPFSVQLPFTKAKKITLHKLSGEPMDYNINAENVKLETLDIPADTLVNGQFSINEKTGGTVKGLPPAEVYLYVFEETDISANPPTVSSEEILKQPVSF